MCPSRTVAAPAAGTSSLAPCAEVPHGGGERPDRPTPPEGARVEAVRGSRAFHRRGQMIRCVYELFRLLRCSEAVRSAWRSPQTKASANPAANNESRLPMDRIAARLTTVSSASLANVAFAQRRVSDSSADCAAVTAPRPKTRSRMPIVLMRSRAAPVGDSVPASRIGAPGAAIRARPTDVRSQPMEPVRIVGTAWSVAKVSQLLPFAGHERHIRR